MNKQQQENNALDQTDLLCAIFDNVAYHYEPPFVEKNKGTAVRRIQDLIQQNPNSPFYYSLFVISVKGIISVDSKSKMDPSEES